LAKQLEIGIERKKKKREASVFPEGIDLL